MTDLTTITLAYGSHDAPPADCDNPQRCLFEWYNWLTRRAHTDARPPGVSPALHVFGMRLNDCLPGDRRQELRRFLPNGEDRLAGTENDGREETRGLLALNWLIRTYLPAWLDVAGLGVAHEIRALGRIDSMEAARAAGPVVREAAGIASAAGDAAWAAARAAAWAAAWDAAGAAAWAAAGDAAWTAAWDAARTAAWDAAGAAAWAAAGDAARTAAWDAAGDAAWAAARTAARTAAWDAAGDAAWAAAGAAAGAAAWAAAWDAAWDAAGDAAWAAAWAAAGDAARTAARTAAGAKLAPVVTILQSSAIALYDTLITGEWPDE
jgi:hypothetical protein